MTRRRRPSAAGHPLRGRSRRPSPRVLPRMDVAVFVGFAAHRPAAHAGGGRERRRTSQRVFGADVAAGVGRRSGAESVHAASSAPRCAPSSATAAARCWVVRVAGPTAREPSVRRCPASWRVGRGRLGARDSSRRRSEGAGRRPGAVAVHARGRDRRDRWTSTRTCCGRRARRRLALRRPGPRRRLPTRGLRRGDAGRWLSSGRARGRTRVRESARRRAARRRRAVRSPAYAARPGGRPRTRRAAAVEDAPSGATRPVTVALDGDVLSRGSPSGDAVGARAQGHDLPAPAAASAAGCAGGVGGRRAAGRPTRRRGRSTTSSVLLGAELATVAVAASACRRRRRTRRRDWSRAIATLAPRRRAAAELLTLERARAAATRAAVRALDRPRAAAGAPALRRRPCRTTRGRSAPTSGTGTPHRDGARAPASGLPRDRRRAADACAAAAGRRRWPSLAPAAGRAAGPRPGAATASRARPAGPARRAARRRTSVADARPSAPTELRSAGRASARPARASTRCWASTR